ncbi:4-hydroxyproline epimerase [Aquimarina sp. EL_43]|uniref:4-hydroxyproline epimerase n=1 Tax=Aquimarina TaxID=290174 RepID=UPI000472A403|nr:MULTISPECIES: 4-hydroxyproline epimerase [Aquimarina]MBG6130515.1 4-hydroxyproline epimerase [Aquimarina sp. EL_35]MBG6149295.1 4-hydroxyproline epimerase [Aquimarina sp. EL_32]MBG6168331.1 4-hydroxyproline epimerase [Aquimarina sp. EL_43]
MARTTFKCIDAHTCGNPVRVVTTGRPDLIGKTMSEKRQHFLTTYDWIRKGLMYEPRGHDMMSGSFLFEPHHPDNDFSILFIETSGCLPMCGHGTIGTITIAIEEGLIQPKTPGKIRMEAPAGLVEIEYQQTNKKVDWVKLKNVKSYLAAEGLTIECPELGELVFDVAYGGNFYAIVDPQKNFSGVHDFTASKLIQYSQVVRERINKKYPNAFIHPENDTIRDVSHMLWTGDPINPDSSGRNAVFYGDKAIDRSPCGTGTSARIAQLYAKGKLQQGEEFVHESFIGSTFIGRIEEETQLGDIKAIIPSIQGWAKVYGYNTIIIDDEDDPYAHGFQVI